ncbi:unnamed protein product [Rotaria sp. Silwood2]|nr:unnamed protein product [Rotaria sp. Silwood2]CAF3163983.1 unnamed protein product [Rotaria sp. Silwood2]CAF3457840.1 unnamed protein product [Rotaria sp. Silwood2]CAF4505977.1 unnamed protein product [Rotaria sp. Silwood2]CAF4533702.1 unnamed protein product [Rotaria sp. Silwood2]
MPDTVLDNLEEKELQEDLAKQCENVLQKITESDRPLSVLVTGGSQAGKSSLVRVSFGEDAAIGANGQRIATGSDGRPVTQDVTSYTNPQRTLELIDTPGLEKNISSRIVERIQEQLKQKKLQPSIVWVVLNYQSSMEDVELELVKLAPGKPVIIIVNKCDFLYKRKCELQHDSKCLEQFDQLRREELPPWMQKSVGLMSKRDRLLEWKAKHDDVRRIIIMSLGDNDQFDDEDQYDGPIGLDILLEATYGCLDDVGRIQLAALQQHSKLGKIQASVAIIVASMATAGGRYAYFVCKTTIN